MTTHTEEQADAIAEFRRCAAEWKASCDTGCIAQINGTRYALEMAAEALRILGIDPKTVTPE